MQKALVLVFVFILSIFLFLMLVGGMSWFSESLAIDISVLDAPVNALNEINNMSRVLTGM